MKRLGPPIALWLVSGAILGFVTAQVADWFVMTDELLYERLALSVDRLGSPIPHVHGTVIGSINQLYPLLLAPVFTSDSVAHGLHLAHLLNAFVMTSAAVPAYLLSLRVTRTAWASLLAAALTVIVPWTVLSSFLLTEVAAYPAFVWAMLAFHVTLTAPTRRHDVLAALALAVAIVARTQFAVLAIALPASILLAGRWRVHRTLGALYAAGAAVALVVIATGHNVLGTYSSTTSGNPLPSGTVTGFFTHLAVLALGVGVIPFLVGGAWLMRREPFAVLATVTIVLLAFEASSYDVRFGGGLARDRYVFYLAPLFFIAFTAALAASEPPRWTLAVPVAVLVVGLSRTQLPVFDKFNIDTPVSVINGYLRRELGGLGGARWFLIGVSVVAAVLVLEAGLLLRRKAVIVALAASSVVLVFAETAYAFERLLGVDGTAGRPLTVDPSGIQAWVDQTAGRNANVTLVPFPINTGEYWSNAAYWWDLEFWNASVTRSGGVPGEFEWTPSTFPKLALSFDRVGRANTSVPGLVLQAVGDTRFHLAGSVVTNNSRAFLVKPDEPWRADWSTSGLYADGWTKPNAVARIHVYPYPGQTRRVLRQVTVSAYGPPGVPSRRLRVGSKSIDTSSNQVSIDTTVCVPPNAAGEVELRASGASSIPPNPRTIESFGQGRGGGVQISRIYLSGEIGKNC